MDDDADLEFMMGVTPSYATNLHTLLECFSSAKGGAGLLETLKPISDLIHMELEWMLHSQTKFNREWKSEKAKEEMKNSNVKVMK